MNDYKNLSDIELVDLLKQDDHLAFTEILRRYSAILINFAYRRVADLQLAEDMTHDVFTYLWDKREQIHLNIGLEPFIFRAAKNQVLLHFRRQKVTQKYIDTFQSFLTREEDSTDHLLRYNNLSQLIEKEVAALPEKMRQVFELNRKKDMSRKEIADHLNMPENTVKTNMQRALRILKLRLGDSLVLFLLFNFLKF